MAMLNAMKQPVYFAPAAPPASAPARSAPENRENSVEREMTSTLIVALGYRADDDAYATSAKSRLPKDKLFTFLD